MHPVRAITVAIAALVLSGCGIPPVTHIPSAADKSPWPPDTAPRMLAVFLDGTANDEGSHTNVAKLHNLVTLQPNPRISTIYIEGVGTQGKVIGMALGWGIGHDVRMAYRYLGENYRPGSQDKIFIFGFSRGAFAARILAALIHTAGIPDLASMPVDQRDRYVRNIFDAYKSRDSIVERRKDVQAVIGYPPTSVTIEFLGLWDTVDALGLPDYTQYDRPNPRYADQLCNIRRAAHALSIDDNRARAFTPVLLTREHLIEQCEPRVQLDSIVDEVWFSGAHSDVGGGYRNTHIGGVSLNWMLEKLEPYGLVPMGSKVFENPFDRTHDPEGGVWGLLYRRQPRDLAAYVQGSTYNNGRLKIHRSVIERLARRPVEAHESKWFRHKKYEDCFDEDGQVMRYRESESCAAVIQVVPRADSAAAQPGS